MIKNSLFTLLLVCFCYYCADAQTIFASTSFEEPALAPGVQYVDTGDPAVDHDLVNNPGQPLIDYVSIGVEMGFDATFITGADVGLTDGDYVGVSNFTGDVGTYIDGTKGYQFQDTDGTMILTFDAVSLIGRTMPILDLYYFVATTGWETGDSIRIWVEVDAGAEIDLVNTAGQDINNLMIEGMWIQLTADLSGFTTATLNVSFASNSGAEELYLDHITFSEGGVVADCSISGAGLSVGSCDPATNEFNVSITPAAISGSATGYFYSLNGFVVPGGPFPYDVTQNVGSFDSDGASIYEIVVQDATDAMCTDTTLVFAPNSCLIVPCNSVDLVLTAVVDADLPGGLPKALEFYVLNDIADLSTYGIGSVSNGSGTTVIPEYNFPTDVATAGDYIYVSLDSLNFDNFFGFAPDYVSNVVGINGNDAIELYCGGVVVDVFGDVNMDGSGTPWEYTNGWAYRVNCTGLDDDVFNVANWTYSGAGGLATETANSTAVNPVPFGTYSTTACTNCPVDLVDADLGGGAPNAIPPATYQVSNSIISTGTVAPGTTVIYDAGTIICLDSGFSSDAAADFSAIIGGCTP